MYQIECPYCKKHIDVAIPKQVTTAKKKASEKKKGLSGEIKFLLTGFITLIILYLIKYGV